ncbi:hypothetical protein [Streptomyces sp. NPDC006012]|uniref:hypothetical protein n=1 Tax=Streptomyces sp. NPDC006012 TaxID=3364739 RepID=UPI0036A08CE5
MVQRRSCPRTHAVPGDHAYPVPDGRTGRRARPTRAARPTGVLAAVATVLVTTLELTAR